TADPDRNGGKDEVGSDKARRRRADSFPAARSSRPPISGHGAPTVMNVRLSDGNRSSRRLRAAISGPSPIWRPASSTPSARTPANSSPVNGDLRPRPFGDLHRLDADRDARSQLVRFGAVLARDA